MQELDLKIENIDREISKTELLLQDLQELQSKLANKSGERKSKLEEVNGRYHNLHEEIEGL